jgi:transcriptional regulator with XRE-family HTH domain
MERANITQSELARRLGIKPQAVNQWLQPGGTAPRGGRLHEVATALGVPLSELLAESVGGPGRAHGGASLGYGQRLADIRIERAQEQPDFAAAIGVPVELLRMWEAEVLALDQGALVTLWRAGISADWLLFGDQRGRRPRNSPTSPGHTSGCVVPVTRARR